MKEQLPKLLQYFYPIPALLSIIVGINSFIVAVDTSSKDNTVLYMIALLISIISLVALVAKCIADNKIKKMRLGINPKYLITKYPKNIEAQIVDLLGQKFELKDKTKSTAHLEKSPYFSIISALVLFLLGFLPGVIYLVWYFLQPKEMVYLDLSTQN